MRSVIDLKIINSSDAQEHETDGLQSKESALC